MSIEHPRSAIVPAAPVSIRALLVDSDDDTREMYAEFLRLASCEVEQAADGRQALAMAISRQPHVVITETQLPGIDGFDLCRLLRADGATRSTPIIVVTGDGYAGDIQRAREAGATEVLVKPCLPDVLLATAKQLLESSRTMHARAEKARADAEAQIERAHILEARVRRARTRAERLHRRQTASPPLPPPALTCPQCEASLAYEHSHIGGVSASRSEQWDYYSCPRGCGAYQYRQRTRKVRRVA
jgi:DNA-binding response OmpR family regulator